MSVGPRTSILSLVGKVVLTYDWKYLVVDREYSEIVGYSDQDLRKVSMWDIVHPEDVERCQAEIAMAARNGKSNVELSCRVSCLDGCLVMVRKRVRHLGKTEVKCETQVIETKDVLMNNLWSKLTVLMDAFVTSCDSLKQTKLSQIQKSLLVRMEQNVKGVQNLVSDKIQSKIKETDAAAEASPLRTTGPNPESSDLANQRLKIK
ncbi:hypothetical protein AAMO2058_001507600 [Amorphochlora amoebiformis]